LAQSGNGGAGLEIRRTDVLSAWQGFRPLASDPNAPPGAPVSRDHVISENPDTGITFITGGKWTTYREMAEDVIDRVIKRQGWGDKVGPCVTDQIVLRGGVGYARNIPIQLVQEFGVDIDVAEHLAHTYGTHSFEVLRTGDTINEPRGGKALLPGYPYLEREIDYACKNEMASSLTDMLTLRTRLAYLDSYAAAMVAPRVAEIMGKSLGWNKKKKKAELEKALDVIGNFGGPIPKSQKSSIHTIEDLFHSFDVNKSGYIGYDELRLCMKHFGIPFKSEAEALAAFKAIDKNCDGKIDFNEFMRWWNRLRRRETRTLSDVYRLSSDKLGSGSDSRGAAFG
jgi:glycerol-3-phosphate dehydrogenase